MTKNTAIGIDLGTTFSAAAYWDQHQGQPRIIENAIGSNVTPSYVAFTLPKPNLNIKTERLVGDAAKNQSHANAENTVYSVKRLIGLKYDSPAIQEDIKSWPFAVVPEEGTNRPLVQVSIDGEKRTFKAEEISGFLLSKIRERASQVLGHEVTEAVITVPAYFNNSQREATKDAGQLGGLRVLQMINEPTAAALEFGFKKDTTELRNVFIFDLGGGTFDVSILQIEGKNYKVLATYGDTHLGGEDLDTELVMYCKKRFQDQTGINIDDLSKKSKNKAMRRLRNECTRTKIVLSTALVNDVNVDGIADDEDLTVTVTRAAFENMVAKHLDKIIPVVEKVLADSKLTKAEIHDIVLVGGSTRMPKVQQMLEEFFDNRKLDHRANQDEAVALGAAILANKIKSGDGIETGDDNPTAQLTFQDVTSIDQGMEKAGGQMSVFIPANTPIPCSRSKNFTNGRDNQEILSINIYQGEHELVVNNQQIGQFDLQLQPMEARQQKIECTFSVDENGRLTVSAQDMSSGIAQKIEIKDKLKITEQEMTRMKGAAADFAAQDAQIALRIEALNDLENLIGNVRQWLKQGKGDADKRAALTAEVEAQDTFQMTKRSQPAQEYKDAAAKLNAIWAPMK